MQSGARGRTHFNGPEARSEPMGQVPHCQVPPPLLSEYQRTAAPLCYKAHTVSKSEARVGITRPAAARGPHKLDWMPFALPEKLFRNSWKAKAFVPWIPCL